jgi:RNA polymerase sigma-70 factor, ECF subfamily
MTGSFFCNVIEIRMEMSDMYRNFAIIDKTDTTAFMGRYPETGIVNQPSVIDLKTFENLFRQYYQMLCSYAHRMIHDPDASEEVVQDLFYTLWERRTELQINASVKSYLFTAVHNRCLKYIEHRNVESKYRNHYILNHSEMDSTSNDTLSMGELQEKIDKALRSLPDRYGKIFRMSRFEGLKYYEIAQRLSISIKTVEAGMGKALKLLRKSLKDYFEIA